MRQGRGGTAPWFAAHTGFFVVHREAVETVCHLAFDFWQRCERDGLRLPCEPLLACAAQMLCGDPRLHHVAHAPDLWLPQPANDGSATVGPALIGG